MIASHAPSRTAAAAVATRIHPDVLGGCLLLALTLVGTRALWLRGAMIGVDSATQMYPAYSFLGERLHALDLPTWNPFQFSGAPFAADLLSGWMYFPAMLVFGLLPLTMAVKVFSVFAFVLAGFAMYALARVLGMNVAGAVMAGVAYEFSGFFFSAAACCPTFNQGMAWLPVALLGCELATRSRTWLTALAWLGVSGFALSQILAVWVNQRAYYAVLVIGAYMACRILLAPPDVTTRWRDRLVTFIVQSGVVFTLGCALAAAGIIPRLAYVTRSNLADGYQGAAAALGGWSFESYYVLIARTLNQYYVGGVVFGLALYSLRLAHRSFAVRFFGPLSLVTLILALGTTTPLHSAFYVLPRFGELHKHHPERIAIIVFLGVAVLAGATVNALRRWPIVPVLLVVLAAADLLSAAPLAFATQHSRRVDVSTFYAPPSAVQFLRSQETSAPFRYFGYDPSISYEKDWQPSLYYIDWYDQSTAALLVNNRATLYGLQDVQGYNPLQPARYAEFVTALNGSPQDYHSTNVLPGGLESPLLDLLGARYAVVPAPIAAGRPDLLHLSQRWPTVYRDEQVRVLENAEALPRAWLVHEARQVARGEALPLLASGAVNPRRTALLEAPVPVLGRPANAARDAVVVERYEVDRLELVTRSDAAGLLMLSDVYDPDWRAYVDGQPVEVFVADHALRAIAVPAGEHAVELRYESTTLRTGMAISLGAFALLGSLWTAAGWALLRRRWARRTRV